MDLDEEFEDTDELTFLLGECGLGFQTPEKVSGDLEDGYEELLLDAAACSGGSVVVDDVEREHLSDSTRYMDWNAAFDAIGDLVPGNDDPRGFYQLDEESYDAWWLLLTPDQAEGLQEFGLPVPVQLGNWVRAHIPSAEPETLAWYMEDDACMRTRSPAGVLRSGWLPWTPHWTGGERPICRTASPSSTRSIDGPASLEAAAADEFFKGAVRYVGETALRLWPRMGSRGSPLPTTYCGPSSQTAPPRTCGSAWKGSAQRSTVTARRSTPAPTPAPTTR
jgi:hypothetical protein